MTGPAVSGQLSYVAETAHGCLIYRETSGSYVVRQRDNSQLRRGIPTLAGAWAACNGLEPPLNRRADGAAERAALPTGDAPT